MNKNLKKILNVLLAFMVTLVAYIVLHEFGHMIVMLSAGAKIKAAIRPSPTTVLTMAQSKSFMVSKL